LTIKDEQYQIIQPWLEENGALVSATYSVWQNEWEIKRVEGDYFQQMKEKLETLLGNWQDDKYLFPLQSVLYFS